MSKPNTPLNVLEAVINNIKDFHEGNINENLFVIDMQYHYPNLVDALDYFSELESENEDLKVDLATLQGDYDDLEYQLNEAEHSYEELYDDYLMTEALLEATEEDEYDH